MCKCVWICALPSSVLSQKLLFLLSAVLGMALSFLLPPTSCQEHDSNLRDQDAGDKNCLRNRGATVVAKGEQPSGHCHKPAEGCTGACSYLRRCQVLSCVPQPRMSFRCSHGQLRVTRLAETATSFVPGVTQVSSQVSSQLSWDTFPCWQGELGHS